MSRLIDISPQAEAQLEFHKVRELLAGYARGEEGREACLALHAMADERAVRERLDEVYTYADMSNLSTRPQLAAYEDIRDPLKRLSVEGYVLAQDEIHEVGRQLEQTELLFRFFEKPDNRRDYPAIHAWIGHLEHPGKLIKEIRRILDEKGDVRPNASPELQAIARNIEYEEGRLNREFVRLVGKYRQEGWLADPVESIRSGRRVLCVQAEFKRKVSGIIHDESTTGRTVFIEPELIVEINNSIIELQADFKKEVYRLLKALCETLHPHVFALEQVAGLIVHWDLIQAMALLGNSYGGQRPRVQAEPVLHLVRARHPLLQLKNKGSGKPVIPFDLVLHTPNRLLILSGPNAGGKSILLKATGLIQLMAQCGMLIPADGGSTIGIFTQIRVDIGDQQSIEEDLSTYSSRLKNMQQTLAAADESTMLLIDEFGSGTDPKMGGAIAEAILDALVQRKVQGIITTHYPNIKMYAHKTKGVVNGAMLFDKENIVPTYQLKIGKPGSSFAFEIAERTGLPEEVIAYARKRAGHQAMELEDLIHDLDDKTLQLSTSIKTIQEREKELDRLIANYEQMRLDLEVRRKMLKIDQKKAALAEASQFGQEMNKLLRDLRKEKNEEKAKEQAEKLKARQQVVTAELQSLTGEVLEVQPSRPLAAGDHVKLRSTQQYGMVARIEKGRAEVIVGQLRMTLPLSELVPSGAPVETNAHRSIKTDTGDYTRFENELDIRGMLPEEATRFVERFIDASFLSSQSQVRIVHGKGTGVLRKLVERIMKAYPFQSVYHPDRTEGGDGVTIGVI
jgi:DNA mismatch repair protein MutS2